MRPPLAERFWARVNKTEGCWTWTGARDRHGYGVIREARPLRAHRVSWELHFGSIPDGLEVCHRCDYPPCVNPAHLWLGTHAENMRDMAIKGRKVVTRSGGARGDAHWTRREPALVRRGEAATGARLTAKTVAEIRTSHAAGGIRQRDLADHYGVSIMAINRVVTGKSWRHVP